jgi:F-type H+-transporting ATPase subunit epsilon
MARTPFHVEILTPEGEVYNGEVEMLSTRTAVGSIGILANHTPLLAMLNPTELRLYESETEIVRFAQGEGYLQVGANRALLLLEDATPPGDLDAAELKDRLAAVEAVLDAAEAGSAEAATALRDKKRCEIFLAIAEGQHPQ